MKKYQLSDCFTKTDGKVFLTGTRALLRLMLDQARRDRNKNLKTKGYITGYRGSPLAMVDIEMAKNRKLLNENYIEFLPAINEELGATQIYGTQQVELDTENKEVDAVFGLWYGKGPGLDRAADALKHGNAYGSSKNGGVLIVAGDDHGSISSTMGHQSDVAFMSFFMPVLFPANVAEFLEFGEYGYALSRFSGLWVGFKTISETAESAMMVELQPDRKFVQPEYEMPEGGLHIRWKDLPGPQVEERLLPKKLAALAFARANPIDRTIYNVQNARFGIVTCGKAYFDVLEALELLDIDEAKARALGIDIYKIGMVWPLEHIGAIGFATGKDRILVVEEKRAIIESQLKEHLYDFQGKKPKSIVGKYDEEGNKLLPWIGELSPLIVAEVLAQRLDLLLGGSAYTTKFKEIQQPLFAEQESSERNPYFCSGCPHNTGTKLPEGSKALSGIGCHYMASFMERNTNSLIQMGGEGSNWVAISKFNGNKHIFQNMGDGTYFHSGSLSIRQAVSAKTNITFKILFNDAVAMTGGQAIDGDLSPETIARSVLTEGVQKVVIVSDIPEEVDKSQLDKEVEVWHRDDLDRVQRKLREIKGTTVLIYKQQCAAEKRRMRKRGKLIDPAKFAYINPLVCEGCGDCSKTSNCLSVEPRETEFGRKRRINLSSCNKDFTCVDGFCPSFVTVEGGQLRKGLQSSTVDFNRELPDPKLPNIETPYNLLLAGIGGTGIVSLGKMLALATQLDDNYVRELDFMGLAQKFGPVFSYIRICNIKNKINHARIDKGFTDALVCCDLVVGTSKQALQTYRRGHTRAAINTVEVVTSDFIYDRNLNLNLADKLSNLQSILADSTAIDSTVMAEKALGDKMYSNVVIVGSAWQMGLIPISEASILKAIELNGVEIELNKLAFRLGRMAAVVPEQLPSELFPPKQREQELLPLIQKREEFLQQYQNSAWSLHYRQFVERVHRDEQKLNEKDTRLSIAVAKGLFKVMSYKDEYEVARLHTDKSFRDEIQQNFSGNYKVYHYLAPPILYSQKDARGFPRKRKFGSYMQWGFALLRRFAFLRGTVFDIFGYQADRREERKLIVDYQQLIELLLRKMLSTNYDKIVAIAELIFEVRGFGPIKHKAIVEYYQAVDKAVKDLE